MQIVCHIGCLEYGGLHFSVFRIDGRPSGSDICQERAAVLASLELRRSDPDRYNIFPLYPQKTETSLLDLYAQKHTLLGLLLCTRCNLRCGHFGCRCQYLPTFDYRRTRSPLRQTFVILIALEFLQESRAITGEPCDAAVNFDTYRIFLHRVSIACYAERCTSYDRFRLSVGPSVCPSVRHSPVT